MMTACSLAFGYWTLSKVAAVENEVLFIAQFIWQYLAWLPVKGIHLDTTFCDQLPCMSEKETVTERLQSR